MFFIALWLGLSFGAIQARAEANLSSNTTTAGIGQLAQPISTDSNSLFDFEVHGSQYLDRGAEFRDAAASSNNSYLFRTAGQTDSELRLTWDMESEYSSAEHWNYFRPREGYVSYEGFSLGRRKFTYSNWEDQWNYGLFESRFTDDKMHSPKGGLIGLFYEDQRETVNWRIGFLPVYLPDMGPHFWVGDRKFMSYNPWFHPPQSAFPYSGVTHSIDYSVQYPDDGRVISQPGGMAQVEWKPSDSTFARFSYAYKPMPQYLEGFPVNGSFNFPTQDLEVQLNPRFLYHHVANLDMNYVGEKNQMGISVAGEHPVQDQMPSDWELQNVTDALIVSAFHSFDLDEAKRWSVTSSIIKVWGGDQPDKGPIVSQQTLFERRYQYTEAASLGLRKIWRKSGLESGMKVVFDRLQNGLVYSGDFSAQLHKSITVSMAFDLIQILPGEPQMPDGFLDVYRGNDRVSLGMSYVF